MKQRTKHLTVKDGTLIPMGNNFAYVLGDHPNKVDDVDIGPNNRNGLSVNHGEIMQFGRTGVRVFSAEPILNGVSPSKLVQFGMNPNTVFAAQERYKDIYHLKDNGDSYKSGGIHIAPSKRGTFTAAAKQHGMGVQAFASKVLANKSNYSPAMVKKANFARNASKWHHALGGEEPINLLDSETKVKNDYLTIPLKGNPLYDITGETKYSDYVTKHGPDFSTIKTTNNRPYNQYNVETAYDYFKSKGLNNYQIAAFLANAIEESGVEPYALDKTGVYYGISQWDNSRYSVIRKSKKDKDYSIEDESKYLNNQLAYYYNSVMNGNTTSDWNHGGKGSGYNTAADARQAFRNATSVDGAIKALVLGYVRPTGGINSYKNRAKVAEQIYKLISKQ